MNKDQDLTLVLSDVRPTRSRPPITAFEPNSEAAVVARKITPKRFVEDNSADPEQWPVWISRGECLAEALQLVSSNLRRAPELRAAYLRSYLARASRALRRSRRVPVAEA